MGVTYKIDTEAGVIFCVAEGNITAKDILDTENRLLADHRFRPGLNLLFDARLAQIEMSGEDTNVRAKRDAQNFEKVCVVAAETNFGIARMYQGWAGDEMAVHVVRDMASAREWLGLPSEDDS